MKRLLLLAVISALAIGSYFLWKFNTPQTIVAWDLVPEDAVLIYEPNQNSNQGSNWLLKLFIPDSIRQPALNFKDLLISIHVIGKQEAGTIMYLSGNSREQERIKSLITLRPTRQRAFESFTITEVTLAQKQILSMTSIDNILVVSSNSFLIEDVIRLVRSRERLNFKDSNKGLFQFARMESAGGRAYVNFARLSESANLFLQGENQFPLLRQFAQSGVVDIQKQEEALLFSGYALDSLSTSNSLLSLFASQRPVPITLQRIISQRTGALIHFGVSDFARWRNDQLRWNKKSNSAAPDSLVTLKSRYGFDENHFYQSLDNEMGICMTGIFNDKLFIVEIKDHELATSELQKLNRKNKADTLSAEQYSHYLIHALVEPDVPFALFAPLINSSMSYYMITEHHIVFAVNPDDLKAFTDDLDSENTWGKSAEWNEFLSTSPETNMGIIIDALNLWPTLREQLNNKSQAWGDSTRMMQLTKGSFQFGHLDKNYFFNGILQFDANSPITPLEGIKEKSLEVELSQPLSTPLTVVKNHTNGTMELLLQDEGKNLLLLSSKLKNQFTTRLDGKIKTAISQIDFYKNNKLQYLFATDNKICLVDRLGKMVKGFPISIEGKSPIRYLTPLDPDNSKNYKFLVTDTKGVSTLYTPEGKVASGWNTFEVSYPLVAPRPVKSNGKDYLITISEDGTIGGYSKSGQKLPGFPVALKFRPSGNWILEKIDGNDLITLVSNDGLITQVDLNGRIVSSSNLVKSSVNSKFVLVTTASGTKAAISRIDKVKIGILTTSGEVLFEKENAGSVDPLFTYYEGDHHEKLFCFTDPQQEFTHIYNEKGESIFPQPLENQLQPAIITEKQGTAFFYTVSKKKIHRHQRTHIN